jgi:hypothetical protein
MVAALPLKWPSLTAVLPPQGVFARPPLSLALSSAPVKVSVLPDMKFSKSSEGRFLSPHY